MNWQFRSSTVKPKIHGQESTQREYAELLGHDGNVIAYFDRAVDGTVSLYLNGVQVAADTDVGSIITAWTAASASGAASLAFAEDTDNGTNTVTVIAPASVASNATVTLPGVTSTVATLAGTETLTNKTVSLTSNTVTGTLAEFNTAISDANILPAADVLRSYLASTVTYNNTDTLADTALSVTVAASGIYDIELTVHSTRAAQPLKVEFGGTATVTNFIGQYLSWQANDPLDGTGLRVTATGTDYALRDVGDAFMTFKGSIEVNGAGTFLLRGAQNAADASNTTIERGSTLVLTKMN